MQSQDKIIILIGPMRAGKSTIAKLLSEKLNYPRFIMDTLKHQYYKEKEDYNKEKADALLKEKGFIALIDYCKPFEAGAVERVLEDCKFGIIDFGGGLSVYEDEHLLSQVASVLEPYENVILLLPSADKEESIDILNSRMEEVDYQEFFGSDGVRERKKLNRIFVEHPSNLKLAKHVFYSKDKSPEQTSNEIIAALKLSPF